MVARPSSVPLVELGPKAFVERERAEQVCIEEAALYPSGEQS